MIEYVLDYMPDGWLYPLTHCIICGEYPISDAYISAYNITHFIRYIVGSVFFWCTLPLEITLITLMEINSHHNNAYRIYFWINLVTFLVKERKANIKYLRESFC